MAEQKQDDLLEHTYSSYVLRRDVNLGKSDVRGSGISMLAADDDDDLTVCKKKEWAQSHLKYQLQNI